MNIQNKNSRFSNLLFVSAVITSVIAINFVFAAPLGSPLLPNSTLDPVASHNCGPLDANCYIDSSTSSSTGTTTINVLNATTTNTQNLFSSTTFASTSNISNANITNSTTSNSTSTNLFSNILTALSAIFGNITATGTLSVSGLSNLFGGILTSNITATGTSNLVTVNSQTLNASTTNTDNILATNATVTSATITNLYAPNFQISTVNVTNGTITNSTSTNSFIASLVSTIVNAVSAIFTNATITNATTTNLAITNGLKISSGGTGTTTAPTYGQVLVGNSAGGYDYIATSSFSVATATFAQSTILGASVTNATATGIFFLGPDGKLSQDTANFNYDSVTKKLTVTGGFDPLYMQIKDVITATGSGAYFEAYSGNNAATSTADTGRLRYSTSTQSWEISNNGSAYAPIVVNGGNISWINATGTNATITNIYSNGSFSLSNGNIVGVSIADATITNATSTNLFATLFNAVTSLISTLTAGLINVGTINATSSINALVLNASTTNATTTNANFLIAGNATFTNATATIISANNGTFSGLFSAATATISTSTITRLNVLGNTFLGTVASGTASDTIVIVRDQTTGELKQASLAALTSTTTGSISFATSTGILTYNLNGVPSTTTLDNFAQLTIGTSTIATQTVATSSITNLNVLATLWANVLSVLNLTATNATLTNATTTNFASTNASTSFANIGNEIVGNSTITNATITTSNISTIVSGGTSTFATTTVSSSSIVWANITNLFAQLLNVLNFSATNATITNATTTNIFANTASTTNLFVGATTTTGGISLSDKNANSIPWNIFEATTGGLVFDYVGTQARLTAAGQFITNSLSVSGNATTGNATTTSLATGNITATGTSVLATTTATNLTVGSSTLTASSTFGGTTSTPQLVVYGDITSKGTQWTAQQSAADNTWSDVAYGNGTFVAVGSTGSGNRVMTSNDGVNWTTRTSAADNSWTGVAYGNGLFVAVASSGTGNRVMTSPDGINWTSRVSAVDNDWVSVTYGNGLFVAVSNTGTGDRVMTSPDGINWTSRTSALDNLWSSVVYGNGLFVAVSRNNNSNRVMTSPDGITWTIRNTSSATDNTWESVTYGNGLFVAVSQGAVTNGVMTSPNGINWTSRTAAVNNNWFSVTYGNGLFLAVAKSGTGNRVMTSPDGITWTTRTSAADNAWEGVTYGNGMFVAVATSGTGNRVMTSGKIEDTFAQNQNKSIFTAVANFLQGFTSTGTSTLATTTSASSTVTTALNVLGTLFASVFNALNFTATNATITNATSTNLVANNGAFLNATTTNLTSVNATITNSTSTNVVSTNVTATNVTASNLQSTSATITNATTTNNLAATGGITANTNRQVVSASGTVSVVQFDITGDGTNYNFDYNLDGVTDATDPIITLVRGMTYKFNMNASGHPFEFRVSDGGAAYTSGVTNNTNQTGITTFAVPFDAPNTLVYQCTNHAGMVGRIKIVNAGELVDDNGVTRIVANLSGINIYGNIDASTSNATLTNATTTNFYSQILSALTSVFTSLSATNATITNATSTNWVVSALANILQLQVTGTSTLATTTMTAASANQLTLASGTNSTTTNTLYNLASNLFWNGAQVATGSTSPFTYNGATTTLTTAASTSNIALQKYMEFGGYSFNAGNLAVSRSWGGIGYGNGTFVIVSNGGAATSQIQYSTDTGTTWTAVNSPVGPSSFNSVTYGGGQFVVVTNTSTTTVLTSPDAITWTPRTMATTATAKGVAYGGGKYVVVGTTGAQNDRIQTSSDGITWATTTIPVLASWQAVAYGGGQFVVTGSLGEIITSPDAVTWTQRTSPAANSFDSITYGGGKFVAVSTNGTIANQVMYSTDGITWTSASSTNVRDWRGVSYGNGTFVAVANDGTSANQVMYSTDGITWTAGTSALTQNWIGIAFGNGKFISVNTAGITNAIMISSGGETGQNIFSVGTAIRQNVLTISDQGLTSLSNGLSLISVGSSVANLSIATTTAALYNVGGTLYWNGSAVGTGGSTASSTFAFDGGSIISASSTANLVLATNTAQTVTIGSSTAVASTTFGGTTSTIPSLTVYGGIVDRGVTWTTQQSAADNDWYSVAYGSGLFVAVSVSGTGNRVMTSPDGVNWTARTSASDNDWQSVTYGNGLFVAVASTGSGNRVMTSPDGINWTSRTSAADNYWYRVTYGNGLFVAVSLTGAAGNRVMTSPDGINWTIRNSAADNGWQGLAYGNGKFVAVSIDGTNKVMTSTDGITWTQPGTPVSIGQWRSLTYGNGLFVATGDDPSDTRVMTSSDGITWTLRNTPADIFWGSVTFGDGLFVAVSTSATSNSIMTSSDGVVWTLRTRSNSTNLRAVTYGNGMFVAVASSGTGDRVLTSGKIEDTNLANQSKNIFTTIANFIRGLAVGTSTNIYGGELTPGITLGYNTVAGTNLANTLVLYAATGTANIATGTNALYNVNGSLYFNGTQVGVGTSPFNLLTNGTINAGSSTASIILATNTSATVSIGSSTAVASSTFGGTTSTIPSLTVYGGIVDRGVTWTLQQSAADKPWQSLAYGKGMFVALASGGFGNDMMTSEDGVNWTIRTTPTTNNWQSVTYGNGLFVAVSNSGTGNRVMTSPDGITWTSRTSAADNSWTSVTYGNGLFVAVSNSGTGNRVMTSPDGITWTSRTSSVDNNWKSVTYGNGLFVAVATTGTNDRVMTSPDGITWTTRTSAADNQWFSVAYGNGMFVAVSQTGTGNRVMTSPDGITWTSRTSAANIAWQSVTYGNGLFVAVSATGTGDPVMTSPDGITWTRRSSPSSNVWTSVIYGNGLFVAVAGNGTGDRVMTSGKIENTNLATNNILQGIWNFMQGLGIGTTTNQYGGSLVEGITLGLKSIAGTQIASVLQLGNATGTANVSTTSNALYNVNGSLYFNGSQVGSSMAIVATTSSTTLSAWNTIYTVNDVAGAGSLLITLPTPVGNAGKTIEIKKVSTTTNAITLLVNSTTTQLIDGSIAYTLTQYNNAVVIRSDGTNYQVVANTGSGQVGASYMFAIASTSQAIAANDHVKSFVATSTYSTDITLDTTSSYQTGTGQSMGRFTLKAGKTYKLTGSFGTTNSASSVIDFSWFNVTTSQSIGVGASLTDSTPASEALAVAFITPIVDTVVELKALAVSGTPTAGGYTSNRSPWATIEVIAGNVPVTGSSVDYVYAPWSSAQALPNGTTNLDFKPTGVSSGNIPYNSSTGEFTLTAGKTYELTGALEIGFGASTDYLNYSWYTSGNVELASTTQGIVRPINQNSLSSNVQFATIIYTPTTNINVKLRSAAISITGSGTVNSLDSYVKIKQLGTTATTEYTNNVLGDFATGGVVMSGTLSEYVNHIQVTQTTQYQTLTLPNPTNTALSRIVYIDNIGTANFDMHGITIISGGTGAFKWNGTAWKNFGIVGGNVASEFGETLLSASSITLTGTNSASPNDVLTFTLPTAGTWEVTPSFRGGASGASFVSYALYDNSNNLQTNTEVMITNGVTAAAVQGQGATAWRVTTTGVNTTFKIRGWSGNGAGVISQDANGRSGVTYKKISGFIPVAGTSVDSLTLSNLADVSIPSNNQAIIFNSNNGGGIPYNSTTGVITLTAGKTYKFEFNGYLTTPAVAPITIPFAITDSSLNTPVNTGASSTAETVTAGAYVPGYLSVIYTPTTNQNVVLRTGTFSGTGTLKQGAVLSVVQIGSSAITQDSILAIGGNIFSTVGSYFNVGSINNAGIQFMASSSVVGGFAYATNSGLATTTTFFVGTSSPNTSMMQNIAFYVEAAIAKFAKRTVNGTDVAASLVFESATSSVATTTNALYALNGQLMYNGFQIGTSSQVAAGYIMAGLAGNQTAAGEIDSGSHVKFAEILNQYGSDISLDTSTAYADANAVASIGRFTLKAGKTYRLKASLAGLFSGGASDNIRFFWANAETGTQIGSLGLGIPVTATGGSSQQSVAEAIFTPSSDTRVDLRLGNNSGLTTIVDDSTNTNVSYATIEVIAGNSAVTGQSVSNGGVSLIGRQTINAANTFQNVNFNTVKTSGGMTVTTGTTPITITTTGRYLLTFNTGLDENANVANEVNIKLRKNSTDIASTTSYLASGVGDVASINTIADLVAGDVISVQVRFVSGTANDIQQSELSVSQLGTSAITSDSIVAVGGNQMSSNSSVLTIGTTNSNLLQFIASSSIGAGLAYATNSGLATTTTFFVGTSSPTTSLFSGIAMYVNGAIARTFGSTFATTTAYAHNVDFGNTSRVRVNSASSAFQGITGIAGGTDGEELTIVNASSTQSFTLYDHSATTTSSAANRIITGTGQNLTLAGDASINLVYDAIASTTGRWRVVGGSGSGGGETTILTLSNFTASSSIGTAAATVDAYTTININQASSSVVLTMASPTITTTGKTVKVNNTGTAMFTMYDTQITTSESGIFTWNGSSWKSITGKGNVGAEIGENVSITNGQTIGTSLADVTGSSFTLPTAGTWLVRYEIFASSGNSSQFAVRVYDNSNNLVPNSQSSNQSFASSATQAMGNTVTITTTGPATYKLRGISDAGTWTIYNNDSAASGGRSRITWTKVSGNAAVTGATVDYVHARFTTDQPVSAGSDITGSNTWSAISGNIPVSTAGVFTLTAGKTYELSAFMNVGSALGNEAMRYQWVDSGTNAVLAVTSGSSADAIFSAARGNTTPSFIIYTPTSNQTVKLRVSDVNGGPDVLGAGTNEAAGSYVIIRQLGSNATTEFQNIGLSNFTASSTVDTLILGASTTKVSAYTNHYSIAQTTTGITLAINQPENTALSRIVYIDNTGTANFTMHGVTVGAGESNAFKWNGTTWKSFGNQAANVAAEYGSVILNNQNFTTTSFVQSTNGIFALPSAGTWRLRYDVQTDHTTGDNTSSHLTIRDGSSNLVDGSEKTRPGSVTTVQSLSAEVIVTTSGPTNYYLYGRNGGGGQLSVLNAASSDSTISWQKISGYIPVTGQTVDYLNITRANTPDSAIFTVPATTGGDSLTTIHDAGQRIPLTTAASGPDNQVSSSGFTIGTSNITVNSSSQVTLKIDFSARATATNGSRRYVQLVKNGTDILAVGSSMVTSDALFTSLSYVGQFSPSDTIDFRFFAGPAAVTIPISQYSISVVQLGSSAATAGTFAALGGNSNNDMTLGTLTNNFFAFIASSTERMRLLATGQLLIGTTTIQTVTGTSTLAIQATTTNGTANVLSLFGTTGAQLLNITNAGRLSMGTTSANYAAEIALNGAGSLRLSSPVGSDNIFTFNSRGVDNFSIRGTNGADAYLNSVNNSTLFLGAASTPAGAIVNQMAFRADGRITVGGGTVQAVGNILSIASSTITGTNALLQIGTSTSGSIFSVLANGSIGIGTTTPSEELEIYSTGASNAVLTSAGGSPSGLILQSSGGTPSAPTATQNGTDIGQISFKGYSGSGFFPGARIVATTTQNWSAGNTGTELYFTTQTTGGFTSGGIERMRIANSGNIGIGTSTPDQLLSINGNNAALNLRNSANGSVGWLTKFTDRVAIGSTNDVVLYASSTNGSSGLGSLRLTESGTLSLNGSLSTLGFSTGVDGVEKNTINYSNGGARAIEFDGSGTTNVLRLYAGNDGSVAERATLDVNGNLQIGKGGTTGCLTDGDGTNLAGTCASDENLKTNILTLDTADMLNKISGMNPVTYNWKDNATGTAQYGIIAQQIESVAPEFVVTDENGGKKVHFDMFNTYFIGAIKELNKKMFASGPQTALTIEEITASSTISVDDKLKALGTNMGEVNKFLAQLKEVSATSSLGTTTTNTVVNTETSQVACDANAQVGQSLNNGLITSISSTSATSTVTVNGMPPEVVTSYQCTVAVTSTTTTTTTELTFVGKIIEAVKAWLADATNGLAKVFVGEVETKKLCVANDNGEKTCLTKEQLDNLINNAVNNSNDSGPTPTPAPVGNSEVGGGSTEGGSTGEGNGGGSGENSPSPEPTSTPEPIPEPTN